MNYSNTVFYKISCKDPTIKDVYVGHTTNFIQRKYLHKQLCLKPNASEQILYRTININGGWKNWTMQLLAIHNCANRAEAIKQEMKYAEQEQATLNPYPLTSTPNYEDSMDDGSSLTDNTVIVDCKFYCAHCNYKTINKKDYNKHTATKKHTCLVNQYSAQNCSDFKVQQDSEQEQESEQKQEQEGVDTITSIEGLSAYASLTNIKTLAKLVQYSSNNYNIMKQYECACGKQFKVSSGLWRHKQKCTYVAEEGAQQALTSHETSLINTCLSLLKDNKEFKEMMLEQVKQTQAFQKQLLEISKEGRNTIINNTNNTNNNRFNLNVYLNETCKDALNMVDFVNSLRVQLSDLEETGKLGYSNGMSRIFINGLKDMDACKRPIHCSDLKREVLYIKEDNVWEKDTEARDKIKKAIRKIEQKNIQQIPLWIKAHPNCTVSSNRENTSYLKMVLQSTGGANPDDDTSIDKIITNIAREVVIDK